MSADIRDGVVVATEHIKAAPEVVFPYFTDPSLMVAWIGERAVLEPRPGGRFELDMGAVVASGSYLTVEPPTRVVFSWGVAGDGAFPPGASTVEVVLVPDGDDTLVVLTHRELPTAQLDIHRAGWAAQLAALAGAAVTSR